MNNEVAITWQFHCLCKWVLDNADSVEILTRSAEAQTRLCV
jgi:hypothetical protein